MKPSRIQGFTLAELVIAIVFVGVVLGPLLLFAARIHDLNSAIGQQLRLEAWRSFQEQAAAAGMDVNQTAALRPATNAAVPAVTPLRTTELESSAPPAGLPRIAAFRLERDASLAEQRLGGAGLRIGAGTPVPPRIRPTAPLQPILMPRPSVSPSDAEPLETSVLDAAVSPLPATLRVEASSLAGARVVAELNQPSVQASGLAVASAVVTAVDLLNGVSGRAWTEFAGDPAANHRAVVLEDGRTRWLVTTAERRLQIYEPSPVTTFSYRLNLGAPVLICDGDAHAGGDIAIDHAKFTRIADAAASARIDFPDAVKAVFGTRWPTDAIGFAWTFHDAAGPFTGELREFFTNDALTLWSDRVPVSATPVLPRGGVAAPAAWTLVRTKTPLSPPVLDTTADRWGVHTGGSFQFTAPIAGKAPVGRLSFENGTVVSTGASLTLTLAP